ncbi:MAG: hypothetical protein Q8O67_01315 [Deltaproteobacteria bacterium]|nr:hypothetical protein [Deltaproteobacteria bacterium]
MRLFLIASLWVCAGCTTARGLADDGRLTEACQAVSRAPSPLFDDDAVALASRVRQKIPGSVTTRLLDPRTLAADPTMVLFAPTLLEIVVDAAPFESLGAVTLVDVVGTRVPAERLDVRTVLAMFGAPAPPDPVVSSSTHTPGPIESVVKTLGMLTIGLPIAIATLGTIGPELGGLFSTGPSTTTWTTEHPHLAEWRARKDVSAAVELGTALGVAGPACFGGRCRVVVAVQNAAAFARVSVPTTMRFQGCPLNDVLEVPLSSTTPLAQTPADTGQWGRFQETGFGVWPVLDDLGDGIDDCCGVFDGCGRC